MHLDLNPAVSRGGATWSKTESARTRDRPEVVKVSLQTNNRQEASEVTSQLWSAISATEAILIAG